MATEIHYEVFRRAGAKGGWTLHEATGDRQRALKLAQELMAWDQVTGVKVVKETYSEETGDYLTLKIFEEGRNEMTAAPAKGEPPQALPCFKPDDLYSHHARQTMGRLFVDFLGRHKVTITELIHRADLLEKLEAAGTVYQHAIQKVAVAQASSTAVPVQQIIKSLNELASQALQRVYRDQRKGLFPNLHVHQFAELAAKLAGQVDAPYLFNGALARHLRDAQNWNEKVLALLEILQTAPEPAAPRALVLSSIDAIMAEILSGSAALHELMGGAENLAEALHCLVELFLGNTAGGNRDRLAPLAARLAADELPEARTALAVRIVAEFKSPKRLCPASLVEELKALRRLANRVVMAAGKYLSHEDVIAAFTLRCKRLVTQESLGSYLTDCPPDEKIERLLFIEENIVGVENKRQLAGFIFPVIGSAAFENFFQNPKVALLSRLRRLAQLQSRVRRASFVEARKDEIAHKLDRLAWDVAVRGRLFEGLDHQSHVEKVQTLLKLAASGLFTDGLVMAKVRDVVLACLGKPGFLAGYFGGEPAGDEGMAGLMAELNKLGISEEMGLSSIAA